MKKAFVWIAQTILDDCLAGQPHIQELEVSTIHRENSHVIGTCEVNGKSYPATWISKIEQWHVDRVKPCYILMCAGLRASVPASG